MPMMRSWGSRSGDLAQGTARATAGGRTGTEPGEDPTAGVREIRGKQPEAGETAGNPAEVVATHARCGSGDGEVAAVGRAGLLQLSGGSRQRETASSVPRCGYPVLAAGVTPSEPA